VTLFRNRIRKPKETTLSLQVAAKLKLVVAACLGGTDYCPNERGKSLGTSRKVVAAIDLQKADLLMEQVCNVCSLKPFYFVTHLRCPLPWL
jgi:hypothetical protein